MSLEFLQRRALQIFPQLASAAPPKPLDATREKPLRMGEAPYCVENGFWSYHQADCRRRRAAHVGSVVGPFVARGACLNPLHVDGDLMWFDPTIPAQHGDIVLFQSELAQRSELGFMSKMLVEFAGEYWLAFKNGMFPLRDIKILGVEVLASGAPNFDAVTPVGPDLDSMQRAPSVDSA